jgi:hypothetical protein
MPGSYNAERRIEIRHEMDAEPELWIDPAEDDPRPGDPNEIRCANGVLYFATPGPIHDAEFPVASPSMMIGQPHDSEPDVLSDRRNAACSFAFAAQTGGPSPEAVALAKLLEAMRGSLDIPLHEHWKGITSLELFSLEFRNVRVAIRTRHPGMRGGLEAMRGSPSGDPEFDRPLHGAGGASTTMRTDRAGALSVPWMVARQAVAEYHAPVIYLPTPIVSPGGGYMFAIHPLDTLRSWGFVEFKHHGTFREAGVRFFSTKVLTLRDADRGNSLVTPQLSFPLLTYSVRRRVYWFASTTKQFVKGARCLLRQSLGRRRIEGLTRYALALGALLRAWNWVVGELRRLVWAVIALVAIVAYFVLSHR